MSDFEGLDFRSIFRRRALVRMCVGGFASPASILVFGRASDDGASGGAFLSLKTAARSFSGSALKQSSQKDWRAVLTALPSLIAEGMTSVPQQSQ
jgi:hypothetical protein